MLRGDSLLKSSNSYGMELANAIEQAIVNGRDDGEECNGGFSRGIKVGRSVVGEKGVREAFPDEGSIEREEKFHGRASEKGRYDSIDSTVDVVEREHV